MLAAIAAIGAAAAAAAQTPGLETPLDTAFSEMIADLSNPDKSLRYADIAIHSGEVPGAISALERLLRLNPTLDNIRLELGVLYVEVGSYDLGLGYLRQATAAPSIPARIKSKAENYIAKAEAATSRHQFHGSLSAGMRYDSDVNLAPGSPLVRAGGFNAALAEENTAKGDFSGVVAAQARYTYDLGRQSDDRIEINGGTYGQRFFEQTNFDLDNYSIDGGPWLRLGATSPFALRPYATTTIVRLADRPYAYYYGGGVTLRGEPRNDLRIDGTFQFRGDSFINSSLRRTVSDQSGTEKLLAITALYNLTAEQQFVGTVHYTFNDAHRDFVTYQDRGVSLGYALTFPFPLIDRAVTVSLRGSYSNFDYAAPDPTIDPTVVRNDSLYQASLTLTTPIIGSFSTSVSFEYLKNDSNLPNFRFDNKGIFLAGSWAF